MQKGCFALFVFYFGILSIAFSQTQTTPPVRTCLTDQIHQEKMANDPLYKKQFQKKQDRARRMMIESINKPRELCNNPVILPMAVHYQNISNPDAACLIALAESQVQILNDDYQGLNTDIATWNGSASSFFPGVNHGETCIEFCLGTQNHPTGYGLSEGNVAVTINATSGDSDGNWSGYINIFVREIGGGTLGYSPLGGNGNGDGVVIDDQAFGAGAGCGVVAPGAPYNLGRTLTHELGHYMNLGHIWGGGCNSDDGIADTPDASTSNFGCPNLGVQSCNTNDLHMNYMDYTNDACMYMFTAGQSTVMENHTSAQLTEVSGNTAACTPPTPVIAFTNSSSEVVEGTSSCNSAGFKEITITLGIALAPSANTTVTFQTAGTANNGSDYSLSQNSVTFPSGSSSDQTVTITIYEDAEIETNEDIQLSYMINANGGNAEAGPSNQIHTLTITNDDSTPSPSAPFTVLSQNFNNSLGSWTITDGGSTSATWGLATANGGLDGSQYILMDSDAAGQGVSVNEILISPVFDGTAVSGLTLDFEQYIETYSGTGDFDETYDVEIWNGSSWQNVYHSEESNGNIGTWGTPNAQSIDLSTHANANNQLRFTFVAQWDYWWALDNIEVHGVKTTDIQMSNNVSSGSADYDFGPMSTIHFLDEVTGDIMVSLVNNTTHDYGCTHVEVDRSAGSPPTATASSAPESEYITDKTFRVIPEFNNTSGSYSISLYYTDEEISGWATGSGQAIADLEMVKASNAISGATFLEVVTPTVTSYGSDHIYTASYSSGFSGFALGGPPNSLPVELVNFDANAQERSILVHWNTASEINNKGFELLRSTSPQDGFNRITWIDGKGTSSSFNAYRYEDTEATPGTLYYYQLNQIDFDESNALSKVASAKIENDQIQVDILPNPVKDFMHLHIDSPVAGNYSIVHASGKLINKQGFDAGAQKLKLDMNSYAKGVYWVIIETEQERIVRKVVLGKG